MKSLMIQKQNRSLGALKLSRQQLSTNCWRSSQQKSFRFLAVVNSSFVLFTTLPPEFGGANRDSSDQETFFNLLLSSSGEPCPLWPQLPVLSWQEHLVWSSAAGARLLQGSTCCVFRDARLQTSAGTSGYFSYCRLSISPNQSDLRPLPPTRRFRPRTVAHRIFSLVRTVLCKPWRWLCMKIPVDQQFLK